MIFAMCLPSSTLVVVCLKYNFYSINVVNINGWFNSDIPHIHIRSVLDGNANVGLEGR